MCLSAILFGAALALTPSMVLMAALLWPNLGRSKMQQPEPPPPHRDDDIISKLESARDELIDIDADSGGLVGLDHVVHQLEAIIAKLRPL
jgi:hypothetical protein